AVLPMTTMSKANMIEMTYTQTASGTFLDYRAVERGTSRISATNTQVKAQVLDTDNKPVQTLQIGDRYASIGDDPIFYAITSLNNDEVIMTAEETGSRPNSYIGTILPVSYNDEVSYASIINVTVPARDDESDDSLRARLLSANTYQAYGGNIADYLDMLEKITDVGSGQVYPSWQGGGTVKLVITNNDLMPASQELINEVQNKIDPPEGGSGYGLAPIDHAVTVVAPTMLTINIAVTLELGSGVTLDGIRNQINANIENYFKTRRQDWDNVDTATGRGYNLTIYRAQVLAEILKVTGVANASLPTLNGADKDVSLVFDNTTSQLPVLGEVTLNV
ncbi:baseplate J/gp47 family protein, partial [Lactobacillus acetotolerans]|uniref:baseplate J/gp47 family protein n=1 Tax=Lactobacillus acetotolerans TaxID=1600 RepID=UPI002FD98468